MDFKKLVDKKTNGRMEVKVYPAGQLGGELEIVDKITKNVIQGGYLSMMSLSTISPRLRFLTLPYLWPSWDIFTNYMNTDEAKVLYEDIEAKGISFAQVSNISEYSFYTTNKEIKSLDDLKGLKIRTQESPIPMGTFKALGASPMPLAFPELYQAMKRGVFDGVAMGAQYTLSAKFYEVCNHALISQTFWLPCAFAVNAKTYKELPPDIMLAIQDSLDELFPLHVQESKNQYSDYIGQLKDKGMKIKLMNTQTALKHRELTKSVRLKAAKEYNLESELERLETKYESHWQDYGKYLQWYMK
jgi:C4-dicarboxylate-binding protein DctP